MSDRQPVIEFKRVSKTFKGRNGQPVEVLKDFSLRIEHDGVPGAKGPFVVLLGPSGCGKSTLLSLLSGWQRADRGEVLVHGERVMGPNQHTATVPQSYTCFPWLTALGNAEFGLALKDGSMGIAEMLPDKVAQFLMGKGLLTGPDDEESRRKKAEEYLRKVGLGDRIHARPTELSGGMQQRVAIARTLAIQRPIVLMDEPFGALDAQTREDMQQMLLGLWEEEKNTIVFVTHDINEALLLGDQIVLLPSAPVSSAKLDLIPANRPRRLQDIAELGQKLRESLKRGSPPEPQAASSSGNVSGG